METNQFKEFEKIIAYHSAPVFFGTKPSALFSMDKNKFCIEENIHLFNCMALCRGVKIVILKELKQRSVLFLYNEKLLIKVLHESRVQNFIGNFGYNSCNNIKEWLSRLSLRINENCEFPHEIGVFLGYPIKDVIGFIENKGKNYLLCGYWKVYSDVEKAKLTFQNYNKCRIYLCRKIDSGEDIY